VIFWYILLILLGLDTGYTIPTASMQPTLMIGDAYSARNVRFYRSFGDTGATPVMRGDIVVFHAGDALSVKRVIGLPGETVQMVSGRLLINGEQVERSVVGTFADEDSTHDIKKVTRYWQHLPGGLSHLINEISDNGMLDNTEEYVVPAGHYFVMGDNHDRSMDSRVLAQVGYVAAESIVSKFLDPNPPVVATVLR
jgi:signal peptidase I